MALDFNQRWVVGLKLAGDSFCLPLETCAEEQVVFIRRCINGRGLQRRPYAARFCYEYWSMKCDTAVKTTSFLSLFLLFVFLEECTCNESCSAAPTSRDYISQKYESEVYSHVEKCFSEDGYSLKRICTQYQALKFDFKALPKHVWSNPTYLRPRYLDLKWE